VQGVGAENRVIAFSRPSTLDIELDGRRRIRQGRLIQPCANAGQILRSFGCLPDQARQRGGKVDGMLAGAAADFQNPPAIGEVFRQDGIAVAGAGRASGFRSWSLSDSAIPPKPSLAGAGGVPAKVRVKLRRLGVRGAGSWPGGRDFASATSARRLSTESGALSS
jgi:hypothetical protein